MPSSWVLAVADLGLAPLGGIAAEGLDLGVDLFEGLHGHDGPFFEVAVALFDDLHALVQLLVDLGNRTCRHRAGQQAGVADRLDVYFADIWETMISMCLSLICTGWLR